MFSRNRASKPEPTPEELREKALDRLHTMAVFGHVNLLGLGVSHQRSTYKARLRALVAYGAASAEFAGQGGRCASVGKAAAAGLIAGPAGAVVLGALCEGNALPWPATLPYTDGQLYWNVTAQLEGYGDITATVSLVAVHHFSDGTSKTETHLLKSAHASGGSTIAMAEAMG
jgi:hypothetical protein